MFIKRIKITQRTEERKKTHPNEQLVKSKRKKSKSLELDIYAKKKTSAY